ncbi:MAG: CopG family transcriptional regulator [Bacillota bacterium]
MKRKQIYLDDESDGLLKKWAALKGGSEASIVREAVAGYLDELELRRQENAPDDPLACLVGLYRCDVPPDAAAR